MSARFLLDTNVVSAPILKLPDEVVLRRLERHGIQCAIPSVVWHELVYGAKRLPEGSRRTALETYLYEVVRTSFPIVPYDEPAATWHGLERARLQELGTPAPFVDGQIAAIAAVNDLILVTANVRDFARFRDIEVQDWTRARARR